jgi:hypothetical protein
MSYVLRWELHEGQQGLNHNERVFMAQLHWSKDVWDQMFDTNYDTYSDPPDAECVESVFAPWPPLPISYRDDPQQFIERLGQITLWIAKIKEEGLDEWLPDVLFRDTRQGPELADVPSSVIPDSLPEPSRGLDYYLVPLWYNY